MWTRNASIFETILRTQPPIGCAIYYKSVRSVYHSNDDFLDERRPATVRNPTETRLSDIGQDIIEFSMAIVYQFIDWQLLIMLTELAALPLNLHRAWMIAQHVQNSVLNSRLDEINFVGPGVVAC